MSILNCNVVRDILPLYADEVVCGDTKALVEEHLGECEGCRRELDAMRVKIDLPVQMDAAESMKRAKNSWGKKQLRKGILVTMAVMTVLLCGVVRLFQYGIPAKQEDILVTAGLECLVDGQGQGWRIRLQSVEGWHLIVTGGDTRWEEGTDGRLHMVHQEAEIHKFPILLGGTKVTDLTMISFNSTDEIPSTGDGLVTLIFADGEITYSMQEEGLWEEDAEHDPAFCTDCVKGK